MVALAHSGSGKINVQAVEPPTHAGGDGGDTTFIVVNLTEELDVRLGGCAVASWNASRISAAMSASRLSGVVMGLSRWLSQRMLLRRYSYLPG